MSDPGVLRGTARPPDGRAGRAAPGAPAHTDARLGALLALMAAALYLSTLRFEFVWDDFQLVFFNQYVRRLSDLPRWIGLTADEISFGDFSGNFYRPGTLLSLALDFFLWGERPLGFHLTSVLLHAAATFAVFRLARDLFARSGPAAAAALLFAVHPAHVEAVAWISARGDLLAALGVILAVLCYRRARSAGGTLRLRFYLAAILMGAASLACKEIAAALPALLLALDLMDPRIDTASAGRLWVRARTVPFWAMAIGHLAFLSGPLRAYNSGLLDHASLWRRLPGALETFARYLGLLAAPIGMRPFYDLPRPDSLLAPWPLLGGLLALGLLLVLWRLRAAIPASAFGLAWLLITLVPVADLVALSPRPMGLADRYLYLASIGFLLFAVGLIDGASARLGGRLARGPAAAAIAFGVGWTALTAAYLPVWRDNLSLYGRMVRDFPDAAAPRLNLAATYLDLGETALGMRELEAAIARQPAWARPQIMLALALVGTGERARGFALFDRAAALARDDIHYYRSRAEAHLAAQEPGEAAEVARAGLRRFPGAVALERLLARALEAAGDLEGAIATQRALLARDPHLAASHEALGRLLARRQDLSGAADALQRALDLQPDRLTALRLLALIRQAQGRHAESLRLWQLLQARATDPAVQAEAAARVRALTREREGAAR